MHKRLLSHDPVTGIKTYFDADETDGKFQIHYEQDVSSILASNVALANDPEVKKQGIAKGWMHAANIPWVKIIEWRRQGIDIFNRDHWPKIRQMLNDPDNEKLKTIRGRV